MVVFYVDDDPEDREIFTDTLMEIYPSAHLLTYASAEEALNVLADGETVSPNIIFMDVHLPLMDGYQTLSEIRKIDKLKDVKVVFYSSSADPKNEYTVREVPNVRFVEKPSTYAAVRECIRSIFHKELGLRL